MSLLNNLIYTAADYKIFFNYNGVVIPLLTVQSFDYDIATEAESIYAIGEVEKIGEKYNAESISGTLELEAGESAAMNMFFGVIKSTQITGATITITSYDALFVKRFLQVNINGEKFSIQAKAKDSKISMPFTAIAVQ